MLLRQKETEQGGVFTNIRVPGSGGELVNPTDVSACLSSSLASQPVLCGLCGPGPSSLHAVVYLYINKNKAEVA